LSFSQNSLRHSSCDARFRCTTASTTATINTVAGTFAPSRPWPQ
jgi:hypothetical protein